MDKFGFADAAKIILQLEGGLNLDENDKGNWTSGVIGKGELEGTKYGISAASHADEVKSLFGKAIADITEHEALEIYEADYWQAFSCDTMPPSLALCVFDSAVQNKALTIELLDRGLTHYALFMSERFAEYTSFKQWNEFGKGWTRRLAIVLKEAAKLNVMEVEGVKSQNGYDDLASLLANGLQFFRENVIER